MTEFRLVDGHIEHCEIGEPLNVNMDNLREFFKQLVQRLTVENSDEWKENPVCFVFNTTCHYGCFPEYYGYHGNIKLTFGMISDNTIVMAITSVKGSSALIDFNIEDIDYFHTIIDEFPNLFLPRKSPTLRMVFVD